MDAFELLKADHRKVSKLFDQLESVDGNKKLDVFEQIKAELDLHAHIEETILYPALEKPEETHKITLEAYEEHKVVKTLLAQLAQAKSANDEWQAKAKVLRENVDHHVEEEENELFEKAEDALSDEEVEALGSRMESEKAHQEGRLAPKQVAANKSKSAARKSAAKELGILTKLANLVGLAGDPEEQRPAKRASARKDGAKKSSKKAAKKASTKKSSKSSKATASKRSSPSQGRKRAASRPSDSKKASKARTGRAGQQASKKWARKR